MNDHISVLVDVGFLDQLRGEWLRLTILALQFGVIGLARLLYQRYRDVVNDAKALEAERGIKAESRNDERDDALRRHAEEISDIKRVVCVLAAQVQAKLPKTVTVDIPEWPSR